MERLILILLLLSGCSTTPPQKDLKSNYLKIPTHEVDNKIHKKRAESLGLRYVDYLHLANTGKIEEYHFYFDLKTSKVIKTKEEMRGIRYLPWDY